jgi:hypothetical protein
METWLNYSRACVVTATTSTFMDTRAADSEPPSRRRCCMEHIAMLQYGEDPSKTTTWTEHITEDEYNGR